MKTVMITGIAGSLGQAFVKLLHKKYNIIGFDNNEWGIATMQKEYPDVEFHLEDFSEWKFEQNPCEYIIACAAYKHLPLGEENPNSFIDNNIIKLRKLFVEAYKNNVDLLFVSTDKAVEPCSLYGATKFIGERLATYYNFSIARCGNLLNSSGSVIPVWEDCIAKGEPLPITDGRCVRYVIEVEEAARQMWDWFYLGDKLIIPQCKKISIIDLADSVYEKHGIPPKKRAIKFIGLRDKEKLEEKLRWDWETV
jgi:UDP-N-acetylglucosamine 4,6-dehydratase/5-epimerase